MSYIAKEHLGPHHIIPESRDGKRGDNIYPVERWPVEGGKHRHWHILFVNMLPEEVVRKIREYTNKDGTLREIFFAKSFLVRKPWKQIRIKPKIKEIKAHNKKEKKKEAWLIVFGDMNAKQAIEWIEREFIRKEWLNASQ